MSSPRVVVVDDHGLFRDGVRSRIGGEVEIVAEAGTVDEAVEAIERERPDVVLLDVRLIARGYLYKEVGLELDISPKTVEHHVSSVLRKLQLSNRHQLSHWATRRRLVD